MRGDASAWQAFVETHKRLVRARVADVASSFGRSDDDSAIDDATAEVFAALLRNNAAALRAHQEHRILEPTGNLPDREGILRRRAGDGSALSPRAR